MLKYLASTLKQTSKLPIRSFYSNQYLRGNCSSTSHLSSKTPGWLDIDIIEVDENIGTMRARYPGLNKKDYDGNGHPFPWRIMQILNTLNEDLEIYELPNTGKTFRNYGEVTRGGITQMIASEYSFEKGLYDTTLPKYPLFINYRHVYTGKTSLESVMELQTESQRSLVSAKIRSAVKDKASQKARSLELMKEFKTIQLSPLVIEKVTISPKALEYRTSITWSDIGEHGYVTISSYVKHCLDALHYCVKFDKIKSVPSLFDNGVKCIRTINSQSAVYGDPITIYVWSSEDHHQLYHLDMKANNISVCQCCIELY